MIIIPARLSSTRFPNKVLCDIFGKPMVVATALNAMQVDSVVVACEDEEIMQVCKANKIDCVLTSANHTSGTDRCAEAAKILNLKSDEIVLNIQADEPFLESSVIQTLKDLMKTSGAFMGSLAKVIESSQINDVNLVKVILDSNNDAIYFSRFGIPYCRDGLQNLGNYSYLGHLGLYGFSTGSLEEFCNLEKSPLEEIEKLEQLRAIYHKKRIAMGIVETKSIGIDTPQDRILALQTFAK